MSEYKRLKQQPPAIFKRLTGLSLEQFDELHHRLHERVSAEKERNPLKKRGLKKGMLWEDRLLLTLSYLREHPTFLNLGQRFGVTESYANKIYHSVCRHLSDLLPLPNKRTVAEMELEAVIVDVTETPIERPKRGQRRYYSGKKNGTPSKPN
jgi:Helix-turn-helix of DDE superfamily endonuclease